MNPILMFLLFISFYLVVVLSLYYLSVKIVSFFKLNSLTKEYTVHFLFLAILLFLFGILTTYVP